MCGINGIWMYKGNYVDKKKQALFEESLRYIDARGGHATGIYFNGHIVKMPVKANDFIRVLHTIDRNYAIGSTEILGHTRFATIGSYNVNANNHPFETDNFVFAHNGTYYLSKNISDGMLPIEKYSGVIPETDSYELLAYIQILYNSLKDVPTAVEQAINGGYGSYAFWLYDKGEDKLYLFREDNPLHLVQHKGFIMFASQKEQLPKRLHRKAYMLRADVLYEINRRGKIKKHKLNIESYMYYRPYEKGRYWYYDDWMYYDEYAGETNTKKRTSSKKEKELTYDAIVELATKSEHMRLYSWSSEKITILVWDDKMLNRLIDTLEAFNMFYEIEYRSKNYAEITIFKDK